MPLARRSTTAVAVLFVVAGSLAAQNAAQNTTVSDPQVPAGAATGTGQATAVAPVTELPVSLAPFHQNASVGVRAPSPSGPAPIAPPRRDKVGSNVALMIVGGAAIVVGAIVAAANGTAGGLIIVGGVVAGGIGLYRYLQ
jgi:hypothetical protein